MSDSPEVEPEAPVLAAVHDIGEARSHRRRQEPRWPKVIRQWPIGLCLIGLGAGLVLVALGYFRPGTIALAVSVLLSTLFRAVLSDDDVGLLRVRSKRTDIIVTGILGVSLLIFALWVPPPGP